MVIDGFVFEKTFRKPVNISMVLSVLASLFFCGMFWVAAFFTHAPAVFIFTALFTLFICYAVVRIVKVISIINMQYIYDGKCFKNTIGKKTVIVQADTSACWTQLSSRLALAKGRMNISHWVISEKQIAFVNDPDSGLKNYLRVLKSGGVIIPFGWDKQKQQSNNETSVAKDSTN